MASKAETALVALKTVLDGMVGPQVERNTEVPEDIPGAGLLILRDGDPGEPEVVLSPVTYSYNHMAEVEVFIQEGPATRDATFDALLVSLSAAVNADKTLSGGVDFLTIHRPENDTAGEEGSAGVKSATVPIELFYDTTDPLN